jgi:hypothetical protein
MNRFEKIPEYAPDELVTQRLSAEGVRFERIVSFGRRRPSGAIKRITNGCRRLRAVLYVGLKGRMPPS